MVGVLTVLALVGCGEDADPPTGTPTPSEQGPDYSDAALWLSFDEESEGDDGATEFTDELGGAYAGRVVAANGGEVAMVAGAESRGSALQFPAPCTDATGCPRVMVEVTPDGALDPGGSEFAFGAAVQLAPDETTAGSNVVQQGRFASKGGQWKLQVDGEEGLPSCLVRGEAGAVVVKSPVTVADGGWHRVVCFRDDDGVSIAVDGAVDREPGQTGPLTSLEPIRIGSPGLGDKDDQFSGRIDDVFLEVGAGARSS